MASVPYAFRTEISASQSLGSWTGISSKRVVDVLGSALALVFLAPVLLAVMALIWVMDPGPVLYAHERVGKDGRIFRCLKFRTMIMNADTALARVLQSDPEARAEWHSMHKLRRDPRVTEFGKFLRLSSIDELPQLLNVLKGDMSLVGPRPIVVAETARYGRHMGSYCSVRPGITGLWQVSGRNDTSYRRRVALDVVYSRRSTLALDFAIMLKTIPAILRADGSY